MTFTISETPWVTLRKGDPSFVLQGTYALTTRAGIEITQDCPKHLVDNITWAINQGWLEAVAFVPKTDPTLIWDTLKNE